MYQKSVRRIRWQISDTFAVKSNLKSRIRNVLEICEKDKFWQISDTFIVATSKIRIRNVPEICQKDTFWQISDKLAVKSNIKSRIRNVSEICQKDKFWQVSDTFLRKHFGNVSFIMCQKCIGYRFLTDLWQFSSANVS